MTRLSGEKRTAQRFYSLFSVAEIDWIPDTVALLRKNNLPPAY
jgi:hypothetical protein